MTDSVIDAYKRGIDRSLLRENLKKSPDERIRSLIEWQDFVRELRRSMRAAKGERPLPSHLIAALADGDVDFS